MRSPEQSEHGCYGLPRLAQGGAVWARRCRQLVPYASSVSSRENSTVASEFEILLKNRRKRMVLSDAATRGV